MPSSSVLKSGAGIVAGSLLAATAFSADPGPQAEATTAGAVTEVVLRSPQPPAYFNGFDVSDSLVPVDAIDHGGPGKDGIPALDTPHFLSGDERDRQSGPSERVMGVMYNGVAKAYPIRILDHHEVVNDRFGDAGLTITYCPLCGSGMVFRAGEGERLLNFGVSGLLYNSDVLLYDRATGSLWSQLLKQAVTGPMKGEKLVQVPAQYTTWKHWQEQYPGSLLLSTQTGYDRDYGGDLYSEYRRLPVVRFATDHQDWRLPAKAWIFGVNVDDAALAVPVAALGDRERQLTLEVAGQQIDLRWYPRGETVRAFDQRGKEIPVTAAYWFAWVAFYPATSLYPDDFGSTKDSR